MVKQALISANGNTEQPARVQEPIGSRLQLNQAEGKKQDAPYDRDRAQQEPEWRRLPMYRTKRSRDAILTVTTPLPKRVSSHHTPRVHVLPPMDRHPHYQHLHKIYRFSNRHSQMSRWKKSNRKIYIWRWLSRSNSDFITAVILKNFNTNSRNSLMPWRIYEYRTWENRGVCKWSSNKSLWGRICSRQ